MSEEEQIIYDEIVKLITENKFISINKTPMTLDEVNNYITNLQQENKQLKSILTELEEYYKEQLEFIIELPAYTKDISQEHKVMELCYEDFLNKIQELKEKYK